jgi:hypothetical protein
VVRLIAPVAERALLIDMAVPAAELLDVNERLPEKLDAPVVVIAPPFVREKLRMFDNVPREKEEASPALFSVMSFLAPAPNVAVREPTLLEFVRLAVTVSAAVVSLELSVKDAPVSEPVPVSVMA